MLSRFDQNSRKIWAIFRLAGKTFLRIDGVQWAGAFAFSAFFSLFPLMILLVTIASFFVDRDSAAKKVIAYMEKYIPISGEWYHHISDTITGVINTREQVGAIAFFMLVWVALQSLTTLISATNRAWDTESYNWWRLPLKSLTLLGVTASAIFFGMVVPVLIRAVKVWFFPSDDFRFWVYELGNFFIPLLAVFIGLSLFYKLAPSRPMRFSEIWFAALSATVLLAVGESLFVIYLNNFATLNVVYGAFGGIMALLLWIYLSGCFFIFGACICSSQAELQSLTPKTILARVDNEDNV
jgi:Ca2+-transporting ATPase